MLVTIYSETNPNTKSIQALIHIRSEEPYRTPSVAYASELAVQVIARTKWQTDRPWMQSHLGACDEHPLMQALCSYIFEPHAMNLLERGGSFVYRKLLPWNKPKRQRVVDRVETSQSSYQLYVPRSGSNSASIDAWMPNIGGFQMTVGKKHAITGGAADDLAKLGPNGNRLYFLVPPSYYNSFTKKAPTTIEQFAILIPYPEEV
ncbi:hypothetical protein PI126_g19820 [Phytophthora idaei]|nr:hypothetical protein PI126_g19820 [Phytophthora idaei]